MPINKETQLILDIFREFGLFSFASSGNNSFYCAKIKESIKAVEETEKKIIVSNNKLPNRAILQPVVKDESNIDSIGKSSPLEENNNFLKDSYMVENKELEQVTTLQELHHVLSNFKGCSLVKTATNTVFGVGKANADLLMIGEAPGADEDLKGEPFVGRSGQLLTKALASAGVERPNIFITNSVFWRPPGNRNPTSYEVALCKPFLQKIISLVKPKVILIVGKVAATALLEEDTAIGKLRGRWLSKNWGYNNEIVEDIKVRIIYHPAYLLRNPKQKKVFWFDLIEISNKIEELRLNV